MSSAHLVRQCYWFSPALPWLELRSTWQSRQSYKTHSHQQLSLGLIEQGGTCCRSLERDHRLQAGDLALFAPQQAHSCNPLPGRARSYHMLYLDEAWCRARLTQRCGYPVGALRVSRLHIRDEALARDFRALVAVLTRNDLAGARLWLHRLTDRLFDRYCQPADAPGPAHPLTQRLRQRLQDNLLAPPSLATLAAEFGLREETLIRRFRQDTGITPKAFVTNARIEYARRLIRSGSPLADAGYQSGFSDQSHFHKMFVQYSAATPGQYRLARSIFDNK
ncbi:AraC family transcriptional regulator [Affinibrenneria salicis]|uniref:AraC family transcriptional regulator n=1 Tax=Affinibrenneria salicis TaxID=2590031 RepID=A0A5J5G1S3_9GAMM|nr:AraC family transcriptional regulator [Affinibrenneria salicis]KAA9000611.1 AraC family transcriptional regulator [Affinibrenneria salicis]